MPFLSEALTTGFLKPSTPRTRCIFGCCLCSARSVPGLSRIQRGSSHTPPVPPPCGPAVPLLPQAPGRSRRPSQRGPGSSGALQHIREERLSVPSFRALPRECSPTRYGASNARSPTCIARPSPSVANSSSLPKTWKCPGMAWQWGWLKRMLLERVRASAITLRQAARRPRCDAEWPLPNGTKNLRRHQRTLERSCLHPMTRRSCDISRTPGFGPRRRESHKRPPWQRGVQERYRRTMQGLRRAHVASGSRSQFPDPP